MPWYAQREALAELHDPSRGVEIHLRDHGTPEPAGWVADFRRGMGQARFAAIVGGGGIDTYRFMEALGAGAVPVVFDDIILPFEGTIDDWDKCVVRHNSAAIKNLTAALAFMSERTWKHMAAACARTFSDHLATTAALRSSIILEVWKWGRKGVKSHI